MTCALACKDGNIKLLFWEINKQSYCMIYACEKSK